MKKSIKILITSCVAAVGVGASIGGAYALYKANGTSPTTFTIGTYTHSTTGSISYIVGAPVLGSTNATVDPDHTEIYYNFPLGGSYSYTSPTELASAQDFVYGQVEVKITVSEDFLNKVTWYSYIDGYRSDSYWADWNNNSRRITPAADPTITEEVTTIRKDVAVTAEAEPTIPEVVKVNEVNTYANQWLRIGFKFNSISTEADFLALAGKSFSVKVTFGARSAGVEVPYIATDANGYAPDADTQLGFSMVPNINASNWEWMYKNLKGANNDMLIWYNKGGNTYYVKQTDGNNVPLETDKNYAVYFKGNVSGDTGDRNYLQLNGTNINDVSE